LEGRGSAQCGIKGQIIGFSVGRAGLDVPAALAIGLCLRSASAMGTHHVIERGI